MLKILPEMRRRLQLKLLMWSNAKLLEHLGEAQVTQKKNGDWFHLRMIELCLNDSSPQKYLLMQFVTTSDRQFLVDLIAGQEKRGEINFPLKVTKVGKDNCWAKGPCHSP